MGNFYDEWLNSFDDWNEKCAKARKYIHEEELEWVRTKQDYRAALLCSRENGFLTAGNVILAEIPRRWSTGKHFHGEEAIFIIQGQGCSVIDGKRYDWQEGDCIFIPFGLVNQHFNLGETTVRYLSVMALAWERFAGVARVFQHEEAGEIHTAMLSGIPQAESDIDREHGRILLRLKDAPVVRGKDLAADYAKHADDEYIGSLAKEMLTPGAPGHRSANTHFMRYPDIGFKAKELEITGIISDAPGKASGKHGHLEALLYVLEGEGYTIIDGMKFDWKKGTMLHVPGPQTIHQHFNTGKVESKQLRIHYGLRKFFQPVVKRIFPYLYYETSQYT